jgi:MoxR-like ATPase
MDVTEASSVCGDILSEVRSTVVAREDFFEEILVGLLSRGHVLIEDVPGTGKTLTARTYAELLGLEFNRIQFTPDLLPTDVTGTNVYDEAEADFEFEKGPLFSNVILADEINRAPPKTQAALLEAMEEGQVTSDGVTHELPDPFFVIATQNPVEQEGTFRLPEAQVDRFVIKTRIGYPGTDGEMELLDRRGDRESQTPSTDASLNPRTVRELRSVPETVDVGQRPQRYMVEVAERTRDHEQVEIGVSPRGLQRLYEAVRARAAIQGRDYVVPDDVKALADAVLAHRLVLTTEAQVRGVEKTSVVESVLNSVSVPRAESEADGENPSRRRGR